VSIDQTVLKRRLLRDASAVITHLVLFKLKEKTPQLLEDCAAKLTGLMGAVPTLRSMLAGPNVVDSARAYDLGLVATYDDLAGLEAYQVHPAHQEVAAYMRSISEAVASVDFVSR
jgi:hypothetical protein